MNGFLDEIPLSKVKVFEDDLLNVLRVKNAEILQRISSGEWNEELQNIIIEEAKLIVLKHQNGSVK